MKETLFFMIVSYPLYPWLIWFLHDYETLNHILLITTNMKAILLHTPQYGSLVCVKHDLNLMLLNINEYSDHSRGFYRYAALLGLIRETMLYFQIDIINPNIITNKDILFLLYMDFIESNLYLDIYFVNLWFESYFVKDAAILGMFYELLPLLDQLDQGLVNHTLREDQILDYYKKIISILLYMDHDLLKLPLHGDYHEYLKVLEEMHNNTTHAFFIFDFEIAKNKKFDFKVAKKKNTK